MNDAKENGDERAKGMKESCQVKDNHHVSRISAAADKRMPVKMVAEMRAIEREWTAGIGPRGTVRLW
ncbi:hypothetical protein L1987_18029 [Smallanthus sonchifolius]|uniref:Uncharacterized protein n=1 Tax=Smallanthus sonchifolius TaxID=185202 RepID=A0ACB9IYF8_9ASTR|nr:hypothetical protein L1987_18029 [Smallanthus sonchifolius]